jgi:hypothetical protein
MNTFKSKIIKLNALSKIAGVSSYKLYERKHSRVKGELELVERTKLLNTLIEHVVAFAKDLGFEITFSLQESPKKKKARSSV